MVDLFDVNHCIAPATPVVYSFKWLTTQMYLFVVVRSDANIMCAEAINFFLPLE